MNGDSFRGGAFGFNIDLLTKVSIKIINLKTKKKYNYNNANFSLIHI